MRLKYIGAATDELLEVGFEKIRITSITRFTHKEYAKDGCNILISKDDFTITHDSTKRGYTRNKETIDEFIKIIDMLITANLAEYVKSGYRRLPPKK